MKRKSTSMHFLGTATLIAAGAFTLFALIRELPALRRYARIERM